MDDEYPLAVRIIRKLPHKDSGSLRPRWLVLMTNGTQESFASKDSAAVYANRVGWWMGPEEG